MVGIHQSRQFHRLVHKGFKADLESFFYTVRNPIRQSLMQRSNITDRTIARIRIAMELPMTTIIKKLDRLLIHEIRFVTTECFLRTLIL